MKIILEIVLYLVLVTILFVSLFIFSDMVGGNDIHYCKQLKYKSETYKGHWVREEDYKMCKDLGIIINSKIKK